MGVTSSKEGQPLDELSDFTTDPQSLDFIFSSLHIQVDKITEGRIINAVETFFQFLVYETGKREEGIKGSIGS